MIKGKGDVYSKEFEVLVHSTYIQMVPFSND